jgi:SAM-dependent methyltransferase
MAGKHQPDSPCPCGNGKRYGDCHQPIVEAAAGTMLDVAHREYAAAWSENADAYAQQDVYDLAAEQLFARTGLRRIFDIGCGLGHGLLALKKHLPVLGGSIIAIDENPLCLVTAADRLGIASSDPNLDRMTDAVLPDGQYLSTYRSHPIESAGAVTLIQSDLMVRDDALVAFLDDTGPLDAVTLWFSGIHKARSSMVLARHFGFENDADHRMLVEDLAIELAASRLRPGGCLQIVTRGAFPSPQMAARHTGEAYSGALQSTPLGLETVAVIPYSEPESSTSIMVRSKDELTNSLPSYAISLLIVRS